MPLDLRSGNHIVQDIGGGNYVLSAHFKSGGVIPKVGDRLTAGQTFAQLGNSGHTTWPHLHFEVMNSADPLRANGIPFVFTSFRLDSRIASDEALKSLFETGGPARFPARVYRQGTDGRHADVPRRRDPDHRVARPRTSDWREPPKPGLVNGQRAV
jgi:murein DD-endopeptidase MepM/ murein hydrolase activator NlpD